MKKRRILLYTVMLAILLLTFLTFTGCDQNEYTVTLVGDEHVRLSTEKTTYRKGETVTVIKDLDPGYSCYMTYGHIGFIDTFEMTNCDITVTATSYPKMFRIEYVGYGKDYSSHYGNMTTHYTVEDEVGLPTPARGGYRFLGWYKDEALTTPFGNRIEAGSTGDLKLYPKFELETYTLTYHLPEGAANNPKNRAVYTVEDPDVITLYPPEMTDREFLGWYTNEDCIGTPIKTISQNIARNIDLYPKFLSLDYTDDGYRIIRGRTDLEYIFSGDYDKSGKYRLFADISYGADEDTPIITGFKGTFDGGGHKITNLKSALFDTLSGATVENLSISSVQSVTLKVETDIAKNIGALVNETLDDGEVIIRNVHVLSFDATTHLIAPLNLGGIVGYAHPSGTLTIDGCTVEDLTYEIFTARPTSIGGIIGYGQADISNSNVLLPEGNAFNIECTGDGSTLYVGGLAGRLYGTISNCYFNQKNAGADINVYASLYCNVVAIGGLVGDGYNLTVTDSYAILHEINFDSNAKSTTSLKIYIAGLVGRNSNGLLLRKCHIETGALGLNFNSTVKKDGYPALRFCVAFLACEISAENLDGSWTSERTIYNDGVSISSQYIDDDHLLLS